jgi:hypothetical protein
MQKMNLDRLIIGFLLGVCLMLALGAGGQGSTQEIGTWQVSGSREGGYILNTKTGQFWWLDDHDTPKNVPPIPEPKQRR